MSTAALLRAQIEHALEKRFPGALTVRPPVLPETISLGISALDQISAKIARGCLTEICGPASSGRTTLLLSIMREATGRGECCALVDTNNTFDPLSAEANGVNLSRVLWVKCAAPHRKLAPLDKALQAADWIITAGGFGLVVLDLADVVPRLAQKIPLASWYRLRRVVESTSTCLVVIEQQPFAKSCASFVISLERSCSEWVPTRREPQNPKLLTGANFAADVTRSRIATDQRKPPAQVSAPFRIAAPWAG